MHTLSVVLLAICMSFATAGVLAPAPVYFAHHPAHVVAPLGLPHPIHYAAPAKVVYSPAIVPVVKHVTYAAPVVKHISYAVPHVHHHGLYF